MKNLRALQEKAEKMGEYLHLVDRVVSAAKMFVISTGLDHASRLEEAVVKLEEFEERHGLE